MSDKVGDRPAQLRALTSRLQEEPLWRAALGSLELFHSNMLEYLFTSFPVEASGVLALMPGDSQDGVVVERERRHLDLIVKVPAYRPIVIENKLFDFPDPRQLTDYAQKILALRLQNPSLVLLSLMDPPDQEGPGLYWSHLSYGELGRRLSLAFRSSDEFGAQLMAHWGALCSLLQELAAALGLRGDLNEPFDLGLSAEEHNTLAKARLLPFALKLRSYQLLGRVTRALGEDANGIALASGYTNGSALIEGFVRITGEDEAGWQLQGKQWRLAVRVTEGSSLFGRGDALRKEREDHVRQKYLDHFDFSTIDGDGALVSGSTSRREFLHFAPDFVYRRKLLADPTVGQLEALTVRTSRRLLARGTP